MIEQPATRGALGLAGIEAPMPPAMGGGGRNVESGSCRSQVIPDSIASTSASLPAGPRAALP